MSEQDQDSQPAGVEQHTTSTSATSKSTPDTITESASSQPEQVTLSPAEALEYIGALPNPNQALSTLAQFWSLIPQGNPLEPLTFNLYRILRQRQRDSPMANENEAWRQSSLWFRIASLAVSYMYRYQRSWTLEDMQHSIDCFEEAIDILPEDPNRKPVILSNYANTLIWRFERQGNPSDLDKSLSIQRQAIESTAMNDPQLSVRIRSLAVALQVRFDHLGELSDLEEAISTINRAIDLAPGGHPHQALFVGDLGTLLRNRFSRLSQTQDLEDAIADHRTAVLLTSDSDPLKAGRLNDLGMSISTRFSRFGAVSDLEEALNCFEQSVNATSDADVDKPVRLSNLGSSLHDRFQRLGGIADLQAAISHQERAVELTPDANSKKLRMLKALGGSLTTRFENLGDTEDINKAITIQQHAVSLCPIGHSTQPLMLDALGMFLVTRFMHKGKLNDLEQGIKAQEQAVSLTSNNNPEKAYLLSNLGSSFQRRFERLSKTSDIAQAIASHKKAINLTPNDHDQMSRRLNNLASALARKYIFFGLSRDIEEAVASGERAVLLTPDDHPDKPVWTDNLGSMLATRFNSTGKLAYLDEAISYHNTSIEMANNNRPEKAMWLGNLGNALLSRFELLGEPSDLDRSILNHRTATSLTTRYHPRMPTLLTTLGSALRVRFEYFKPPSDLDEAVTALQDAVSLTPHDHPERPARLSNLGNALVNCYDYRKTATDLETAIEDYRLAVQLTGKQDPQRPIWMAHLGVALRLHFNVSKEVSDLDEGIALQEAAVLLIPDTHPEKSKHLRNLAHSLTLKSQRFPELRSPASNDHILDTYFRSFQLTAGSPTVRLQAIYDLAKVAHELKHSQALIAFNLAMDYIPSVIWLGKTVGRRYKDFYFMKDLVNVAAAEAFYMKRPDLAVRWLEQGRSIVWNQTFNLRTPLNDLRQVNASLADRFGEVSSALDHAGANLTQNQSPSASDDFIRAHHRLADEWDHLIEEVRSIPGFQGFLRPPDITTLVHAAHSSSVVVINIFAQRCDAVILPHGTGTAIPVPLPSFSYEKASLMRQHWAQSLRSSGVRERGVKKDTSHTPSVQQQFEGILLDLWLSIVHPILEQLGYLTPRNEDEKLPRITWCATGPLSFLPLHAAGNYSVKGSPDKIFNYVVSSYTPTMSALLNNSTPVDDFRGILAVGQSTTRGMSSLPGTTEELNHIQQCAAGLRFTRLEGAQATHAAVIDGMHDHSWVHLACHASQNLDDPTSSALYLHDKPLDLATISQAPFRYAGLAFLSACQTATGVENLSEESVHLAAGMLMSGYPSVIATMWSVRDQDAPSVAEHVYAQLIKNGVASTANAARALHEAVAYLREHVGESNFEAWVPYIYVGI
ncbi:hypothetical protein FRC09_001745 [Ceratobasidium sp. 395]|nr:hypothetical protein FRC09_001745 [Ceratobasidium sp. 395]